MTPKQLKKLETELKKRGYRKFTQCLTSSESWAWFKSFDKTFDENGEAVSGYQVSFRIWDFTRFARAESESYGFDFWASPLNTDGRIDIVANWEPIEDIDKFEEMAQEFYELTKKYLK